ncbi:cysteine desulfurase family protein [Deinococcus maricopensis]|uniref:cysteine desulfurase n=1 Tax=Deinococcus maricopensis (strain DSM 21211 / LMG 22137 / NRRL B-23946 / LB-34) TaxID=709986 RepID=E8U6A6_DEIML|nr:cysteine desulfurase family protein [Deinococcus maricopensis]ADV66595.1 Cysteine desulfurase [Deinococcus maricopensis DSM 21211]
MRELYLDYAATHPMTPDALSAYLHAAQEAGNAASVHRAGQRARERLEEGRAAFADAIGAHPLTVIANAGGTEGDNHVLQAVMAGGGHLITTLTEHSAVLAPARALQERGVDVTFLPPDRHGRVTPEQVQAAMRADTRLVSVHHANNEIGTVQDVAEIARVARAGGALMHTDAVQSLGVLPVNVVAWDVDFASFSAHKWGGPKGVGFLYVRRGLDLAPLTLGGGQEKGVRPGTHNVAGVYAAGLSAHVAAQAQADTYAHLTRVHDAFLAGLAAVPDLSFNHASDGSPKVVNVTAHGADGEALLMNLDMSGVYASAGSACSAGTMQASHVLMALGLSEADARASLRFSFGRATTEEDATYAAGVFARAVQFSRA